MTDHDCIQVHFAACLSSVLWFVMEWLFLCLVLVELKAQCHRAYVCVRNTCCSCNMSWSVLPLMFHFWRRVICHEVSTTRRFGLQNPELVSCVCNSDFSCILSPTTPDHFRAMFVWFSYPEKTWHRWQGFATIAPCAHVMCLFNDLGKVSMFKI